MQKNNPLSSSALRVAALAGAALVIGLVFRKTFEYLYQNWQREEYSYGFLIPLISAWLVWQRRRLFERGAHSGSWLGVAIVAAGVGLLFLDTAASIVSVNAYALVVVVAGCIVAMVGWGGLKVIFAPVALLLLMIPLPVFWYNNLSAQLQLISSQIGVDIIRALGVSVYLEGNVIDLGSYKLQVAEACSGLRYLFPLVTLGIIVAYLFKGRTWMRWTIVLSTLPIAVLMNSVRIGVIGLLVDRYGIAQAEGFLHQFEGWIIFMACFALLMAECLVLHRLAPDGRSFAEALRIDPAAPSPSPSPPGRVAPLSWPAATAGLLLALAVYPAWALPERTELRPAHTDFSEFPLQIGSWEGRRQRLDQIYVDTLKFDDYLLINYAPPPSKKQADGVVPINVYVAYYASQRSGHAEHSPGACLPAGGWRVDKWQQYVIKDVRVAGSPVRVNRAVIQQGAQRQLVYYWFRERGRDVTNEYLAKWYLFTDALTRNRSDGALVRIIMPLQEGEDPSIGDERLSHFGAEMLPVLERFVGG